jgi:hypothetical protein
VKGSKRTYVVCIRGEESSDIEVRKIYEVLPDEIAAKRGYVRVVDESGEDYVYPEECFAPVHLAEETVRALTLSPSAKKRANTGMQPTAQKTRRG